MKVKRKTWVNRVLGVALATILAVQPMSVVLSPVNVVYAAEMTELAVNGNFSDVAADGSSATNWEMRKEGMTTGKFEGGKAIFDIQTMGSDWANYLKYTPGINLVNGQNYEISFCVKSSVDRTVQFGFDGGRLGINTKNVKAGEDTFVNYTFTAPQDWNSNPYMFYLGNIDNTDNPTEAHTVEISNFSVKTIAVSGGGENMQNPSTQPPSAPFGVISGYWGNEDANKGKIRIAWGHDSSNGGAVSEFVITINGKEVGISTGNDFFTENIYTAGVHEITVAARNANGSSDVATGELNLTEEQAGVKGEGSTSVSEVKGNLLKNGNFAEKKTGWDSFENNATVTWNEYSTVFEINGYEADWGQSIKQAVSFEQGATYKVSFDIESTIARTVSADIADRSPREFTSETIPANTKTTLTYETTAPSASGSFFIYLGGVSDAHTVTISNVSIVKVNEGGSQQPVNPGPEGADTEDGEKVEAVEGNLLQNGNFADKDKNWGMNNTNADVYFNKYRTVFQIKGEAADWGQGLYQLVTLQSGPKYKVSFDVETSVERKITVDINDAGREFTSELIPANKKTTISYETSDVNNGENKFYIYLGGVSGLGNHKVVISNVSIVEMPEDLPNTENDTAPAPLTGLKGINVEDAIALKDGKFTDGLNKWETWCVDWMQTWNVVKYTPVENGMSVYITNIGDGEGNVAWDVQLNQNIDLKKDLQYTISFDVHTEKARAFNVVINDLGTGEFVKPIGLQKDETRHVVLNIPVQSEDALNKLFSIQMGKVTGEVRENTLTFTNMKIEVNGCEELAARVTDGEFTEGLGNFMAQYTEDAIIKAQEKSVQADILSETDEKDVTLTRGGINLESGVTYNLSFMAGATSGNRDISAKLPDGTIKTFTLTDEATLYTAEITPGTNISAGELVFLLGGETDNICIDTVYLNAAGYAEATGMKLDNHDIKALTKNVAPVISEDANAVEGEDIILTFADTDGAYSTAITGVKVNGMEVDESQYVIEQGKITLDKSLFTVSGERQTYNITIEAYWYEKAEAIQIVYKTNQWNMTWSDEFNGTELDMSKWSYQEGTGAEYGIEGWGNNEQQYYTRDNAKVGDGTLTITATGDDRGGKPYSSARIWTMSENQESAKFAQTYGRFEAKIKMPAGEGCQGLWPAFWLLPADSPYGGWPVSGEIDIMEARGRQGDRTDSTLHYGKTYPNEAAEGKSYVWDDDLAITEYHIYSVDWTPTYMSFQVDGVEFYRASNWYCQGEGEPQEYAFPAPFDQDFYIILNLAVGGMYDGNRNPSEDVLPAEMQVDYVRVYESSVPYGDDYIAPEPDMDKDEVDDDAKTGIIDPAFTDVKTVVNDDDEKNVDGWNLLTLSSFGGAAGFNTAVIDGDTFAKVNITNTGNANYAIQLTQKLSLYKGHWYTLSFDAKADTARDIIAKIGGDGTNSWSTYFAATTKLANDVKHYEYTFQMLNESDISSRLEMNMGLGTATNVYIGNVEFKEVEGFTVDTDMEKAPLDNGNHIYNGDFSLGDTARMAYWNTSDEAGKVIKKGSEYVFRSESPSKLYQRGIELLQSDTYKLTFSAESDSEQSMEVIFSDADGNNVYAKGNISIGTLKEIKEVTITMPEGITDNKAMVTFNFPGAGIEIDKIVLTRETYNNVDYSGLNCYPLANGDFELGTIGWSTHQTSLTVKEENGNSYGQVEGKAGGNLWDAMLIYSGLQFVGGYDYELSFDMRANKDVNVDITMEDGSYTRHFSKSNVAVETEWKHYSYDIKFGADTDLALKVLVAGAKEAFELDIDNVVIRMKGAPDRAGSFIPDSYNVLGKDLVITHNGTQEWSDKAVILIDGEIVPAEKYEFNGSKLTLDSSLFTESKEYTIRATAEGYADSTPVTFRLYPSNNDLICNGNMNYGNVAWSQYIHGGNSATLKYDKGYLAATYHHAEGDEWGNPSVPWSIQWNQNITVNEAGDYDISFVAFSEVERYIMVTVAGQTRKVKLTTEPQVHVVTVNIANVGDYEVQFQMGTVDPDVENGYFPAEGFEDFAEHNFYLDSISMLPANTEVDKSDSELYSPILPDEEVDEGENGEGNTGNEGNTSNTGNPGNTGNTSQSSNNSASTGSQSTPTQSANNNIAERELANAATKAATKAAGTVSSKISSEDMGDNADDGSDNIEADKADVKENVEITNIKEGEDRDILNIGDEEVPAASVPVETNIEKNSNLWWLLIAAAAVTAVLVAICVTKKKETEE